MAKEIVPGNRSRFFGVIGILLTLARLIWQIIRISRKTPVPVKDKTQL